MPPFDYLPPGAAEAIPLADAFRHYAFEQLCKMSGRIEADIRANATFHFLGSPGGVENFVLREFRKPDPQSPDQVRKLNFDLEIGFVRALRDRRLRSWARGSLFAPLRELPPSSWRSFWPGNLHKGVLAGPANLKLFDVRVAPRISSPLLPAVRRSGPENRMPVIEAMLIRRRRSGLAEPTKEREATALAELYRRTHTDDKRSLSPKRIRNWLGTAEGDRAWSMKL